ncbi:MAG: glycosyltransferase family 2 protein [Eubacterium sp.]
MKIIKVSIVIPIYNAEPFLRDCLNSVMTQTYEKTEILLVEDGSEDNSMTICEEYAKQYKNIRIFTTNKVGAAMARQRGFDVCKGEAVVFVDADDYLPGPDVVAHMVDKLEETQADIICGNYSRLWKEKKLTANSVTTFSDYSPDSEAFRFCGFFSNGNLSYVWGKMYRTSFLRDNDIHYFAYRYSEDKLFNLTCYAKGAKYAFLTEQVYVYRRNEASVSYQYRSDSVETWIGIAHNTEKVLREEKKEEQDNLVGYLIIFAAAFDAIMNEQNPKGRYGSAKKLLQRYGKDAYCKEWFRRMSHYNRVKNVPSTLWRLMLQGFSLCMKAHLYGVLSLGIKMMVRLRIDESLSDTGKRG